jgi:hypothetical protein
LGDLLRDLKTLEFGFILLREFRVAEFFLEGPTEWSTLGHGSTLLHLL